MSIIQRILPVLGRSPAAKTAPLSAPVDLVSARPLLRPSSRRSAHKDAIVEPKTGPFDAVRGRSTLVALDLENIDRSAQDIGRVVDYGGLARVLRQGIGPKAHLIAVFSCSENETRSDQILRAAGWATYMRRIEVTRTRSGMVKHANADVALATAIGAAVIALDVEAIVLATGDGSLAIDVARCIKAIAPRCKTAATLSLPGSTSHRLDARRSSVFLANLEIGDDVMDRTVGTKGISRKATRPLRSSLPPVRQAIWPAVIMKPVAGGTPQ